MAGAYPSVRGARGRVRPGQVANIYWDRQPFTHTADLESPINPTTVGGSHTCREPTQTLSMQNPHRRPWTRVKPRICLLWGNGANHHTAVPLPNIIIIFMNSVYEKRAQAEMFLTCVSAVQITDFPVNSSICWESELSLSACYRMITSLQTVL